MIKKVFRGLFTVLGVLLGTVISDLALKTSYITENAYFAHLTVKVLCYTIISLFFGIIFFFISPYFYKAISKLVDTIEKSVVKLSGSEIIFGAIGAISGLIIASLVCLPIKSLLDDVSNTVGALIGNIIYIFADIIAVVIGVNLSVKRRNEIVSFFQTIKKSSSKDKKTKTSKNKSPKVLDTSVIIDGRIFDLCKTGFIEGTLVIPSFVLDELRHVSDCSDSLKRVRGRRGLDILNKIQKELDMEVEIWEGDFPDIQEVDSKLLKLSQKLDGKVLTNDYNLNKVAEVQGVPVLNINELANAIKPVVLPGEEMRITIVKDGKESGQGVAYLDDGTMIVVEGGRKFMGEEITVDVTSVLQTAAGRMIFAKKKD
ncbi:PIN/TRAM domain-containing protein [Clostridium mediterraneense]|uniref:PIN/TRAM domain-containing protein n=1 Tax=Clostridium mediterraneense TaxID=1805472 RepID=UPI000829DF12|nr:PIN/TRAM domain-containing protein [Clostridium mediterraneense]